MGYASTKGEEVILLYQKPSETMQCNMFIYFLEFFFPVVPVYISMDLLNIKYKLRLNLLSAKK